MSKNKIELLAPAKNKICAFTAIDYGADAVYIGANEFGARKNVPNSLDDIKEIVDYAHKFNVKVYVTVNTILADDEVLRAKELIEKLSKIGVDAVIIQDMGLVSLLKEAKIPLHASTQCDNRTVEKVEFLENAGFSRVVLARELSIEQIKEIKKETNVELEVFIHGALCVSYSGQCYLSELIGGRSANRGECAQPCRKKYSLVDEDGKILAKDKYLLCLKDFNASKHIKELADAGVTSFKIEGRLKDENYVKNVVAYYRKLIDDLGLEKTSSGKVLLDFEPDLVKSFNRGFTDYFLDGKRKEIFSFESPKSKGEFIGTVKKIAKDYFEIDSKTSIAAQDGLCFFDGKILKGCLVNKIDKNKVYPNKMEGIKQGAKIYRNVDVEFEKKLKNSKTCRKLVANIEFSLRNIKITDEDGNFAQIPYEFEEFAQNKEKMEENIIKQLKKSGESDFLIEKVQISTEKMPFLPVSKLNELRRELLEKLAKMSNQKVKDDGSLRGICKANDAAIQTTKSLYSQVKIDYKGNVLNKYAKEFYEERGMKVSEMALESGQTSKNVKVAMTTKHCLKYAFGICKSPKKLFLIDEKGKRYALAFDCKNCEMQIIF